MIRFFFFFWFPNPKLVIRMFFFCFLFFEIRSSSSWFSLFSFWTTKYGLRVFPSNLGFVFCFTLNDGQFFFCKYKRNSNGFESENVFCCCYCYLHHLYCYQSLVGWMVIEPKTELFFFSHSSDQPTRSFLENFHFEIRTLHIDNDNDRFNRMFFFVFFMYQQNWKWKLIFKLSSIAETKWEIKKK